jgi:hypothetical protein
LRYRSIVVLATLIAAAIISTLVYSLIYYFIIPTDLQEKALDFHVSTSMDTSVDRRVMTQTLSSKVQVGNNMAGYFHLQGGTDYEIKMD